ncbi:MAG TPA: PDZ domain-containing protein [Gemmataceae bacterium]|nr:PDZ domain-containing protein [Gemmataceae bacterium]
MRHHRYVWFAAVLLSIAFAPACPLPAQQPPGLNDQMEKAIKDAAKTVGPSVVQIQTQGGADIVVTSPKGPVLRKGIGPTTGVIVDADGYIISSAFNFSNNPASIIVSIPGQKEPVLAKKIATDTSRMLTLIKVEKTGLPVPKFVPVKELKVGQSAIALGRTLDFKALDQTREHPPSISYGIISALGRIWGKAIQTDAKISPVNYGGPLIDITGRVQGIIVPASPDGSDVTAGFEWYDSGIGFAIPMEDIMAVVPKLKKGKDLEKAALGVNMKGGNQFGVLPEIAKVAPGSAADKAGLKPGDIITEIDGKAVVNQAQIMHLLGPKYIGDTIALKYKRGKEEKAIAKLDLIAVTKEVKYQHPFMGVLAIRDDPKLGVEVRYVYPKSPAEAAGIKTGDRIVKYGKAKDKLIGFKGDKRGRDELADFLNTLAPGSEIVLAVNGQDGKDKGAITLKLNAMPGSSPGSEDIVPAKLLALASAKKALAPLETNDPNAKPPKVDQDGKKAEIGMLKRTNAGGDRKYWIYVPKDYNPQISYAVVVWLHPPGKFADDDCEKTTDAWDDFCTENKVILVGPLTEQDGGWTPSDTELVLEAVRDVTSRYTVDKNRIIAYGLGNGGQMAFHMAFKARDTFRAAATLGAVVTEPTENVANQRLSFYVAGGDRDPVIKAIVQTRDRLINNRFPVFYRQFANRGREPLDDESFAELVRWIDSLDRL